MAMTETRGKTTKGRHRLARFVTVFLAVLCLLPVGAYLLLAVYIRTPAAARQASRLLTDYLHQPVTLAGLGLTGKTLSIEGLMVGNPADFGGELVSSRSLTISPDWRTLLGGRKSFREIAVSGLRVTLTRNGRGEWNFSGLARRLTAKKGQGETLIRRLSVSDSALAVEGFRLDHLALDLRDLATKGTSGSRFLLTCKDVGGNPFRIEGSARLGAAPTAEVVLSAPSFSLQTLARSFGKTIRPELGSGRGALALSLKLAGGKMAAEGRLGAGGVALPLKQGRVPVNGELTFAGRYDLKQDELTLDSCTARLNGAVTVHASGTVRRARKERLFAGKVSLDEVALERLYAMLPQELRRDLTVRGRLEPARLRFSGDARGVTAGEGTLSLRGVSVAKGERRIVQGLAADASLAVVKEGWRLRGRVFQREGGEGGVLEALEAPFTADFSRRLRPLGGEIPACSATVLGLPVAGRFGYRPGTPDPLAFRLDVRRTPLARLNRSLPGEKATFSAGTAELSLEGAGRGPREFTGKARLAVAGMRGSAVGREFAVREGVTEAGFASAGGKLSAAGKISCGGALLAGKSADFALSYRVGEGRVYLADGTARLGRTELRLARASGALPRPMHAGGTTRLPLRLELSGLEARSGAAVLDGVAGNLAVDYVSGKGRRWLEGSGTVTAKKLLSGGEEVGSLAGKLRFDDRGGTADIGGKLLEGRLSGTATLDPFAPRKRIGFRLNLAGARCERLNALAPRPLPVRAAAGLLDVKLEGSHAGGEGVRCRIEADGSEIALAGKGEKTLLAGGRVRALGELSGGDLIISEGVAAAGEGVTVSARGKVARFLAPDRSGELSLALPETSLDALLGAFVNLLPRGLQEASAAGTIGADGVLRISGKRVAADGRVSLTGGGVAIPSQKLSVEEMSGTIPFSLDLVGAAGAKRPERRSYSRENYPSLLAALRQEAKAGRNFRIGRVRFGGMELGETSLAVRAGDGLMEITSLKSALFGGALLGEGFFRYGKSMQYGADLAVSGVSLRALCDAYPKIKGYISGKVDGVASLYGEGRGVDGLRGFTEIWTRSAPGEKMLVSKEFLQKLAGRKLKGVFFRADRPYDRGEIRGYLEKGYLTFDVLDISHTNIFGIKDLSVTVAPVQNKISLGHLLTAVREAAARGKAAGRQEGAPAAPVETDFKWEE